MIRAMPNSVASLAAHDAWVEAQHEHTDTRPLTELERELTEAKSERAVLAAIWPHKSDLRERHAVGV